MTVVLPQLAKRVAIVTGGSGGIGGAIATALATAGARVMLAGRDTATLDAKAAELSGGEQNVLSCRCDVTRKSDVRALIEQTLKTWGQIDILVNCAGTAQRGPLQRFREEDWDRLLAVNLKGVFLCAQAVFPQMRRQRGGWIINIASYAGKVGIPSLGAYCAAKFGVVGLTQVLADEGAAYNIRATAICPSYVNTPLLANSTLEPNDVIQPSDVAGAVVFLVQLSEAVVVKELVMEIKGGLPDLAKDAPATAVTGT